VPRTRLTCRSERDLAGNVRDISMRQLARQLAGTGDGESEFDLAEEVGLPAVRGRRACLPATMAA